jgi:hypothetical protein
MGFVFAVRQKGYCCHVAKQSTQVKDHDAPTAVAASHFTTILLNEHKSSVFSVLWEERMANWEAALQETEWRGQDKMNCAFCTTDNIHLDQNGGYFWDAKGHKERWYIYLTKSLYVHRPIPKNKAYKFSFLVSLSLCDHESVCVFPKAPFYVFSE